MALVVKVCRLEARMAAFARFDRALREAKTNWAGLLDGQRLERMAGREEADCRDARKGGPP